MSDARDYFFLRQNWTKNVVNLGRLSDDKGQFEEN